MQFVCIIIYGHLWLKLIISCIAITCIEAAVARSTQTEETVTGKCSLQELEHKAKSELEALSTPCNVRFTCSIISGHIDSGIESFPPRKKRRLEPEQSNKTLSSEPAASSVTGGDETQRKKQRLEPEQSNKTLSNEPAASSVTGGDETQRKKQRLEPEQSNKTLSSEPAASSVTGGDETQRKKQRLDPEQSNKILSSEPAASSVTGGDETQRFVELNWVEGDNKDILHQILQHLNNKLKSL